MSRKTLLPGLTKFHQFSTKLLSKHDLLSRSSSSASSVRQSLDSPKGQVYSERRVVGYSCDQMFDVVSKVEDYHKFVPFCKKSDVVSRRENSFTANMEVGFPPVISESYTATVSLIRPHLVTSACTDLKVFHHLNSVWKFSPCGTSGSQSCMIDFAVAFEFRSSAYSHITKMFMDEIAKSDVEAFLKWAELKCRNCLTVTYCSKDCYLEDREEHSTKYCIENDRKTKGDSSMRRQLGEITPGKMASLAAGTCFENREDLLNEALEAFQFEDKTKKRAGDNPDTESEHDISIPAAATVPTDEDNRRKSGTEAANNEKASEVGATADSEHIHGRRTSGAGGTGRPKISEVD